MGLTHFRSHVVGHAGTERIASMNIDMSNASNSYLKLSANNFIFWGTDGCIDAIATTVKAALPSATASGAGWIYLSNNAASGGLWYKVNGTNASMVKINAAAANKAA